MPKSRRHLEGRSERKTGKDADACEEAAQAGLTDKFLWIFPPCALDLPDKVFFFFFFSFLDETFQKLILPINTRKLYPELKTFYR